MSRIKSLLWLGWLSAPGWAGAPPEEVISQAQQFKGTPYVWAGTGEKGFDCSGFAYEIFRREGYKLPRMADEQFYATQRVARQDLQRGDLVFFSTYMPGPSHVGIYLGQGKFIHASSAGGGVIVSQMNDGYYSDTFIGGGRPPGYNGEPSSLLAARKIGESLAGGISSWEASLTGESLGRRWLHWTRYWRKRTAVRAEIWPVRASESASSQALRLTPGPLSSPSSEEPLSPVWAQSGQPRRV